MKIILSFPEKPPKNRPEVPIEVETIPRKGELVSLDGSSNFTVEDVIHDFKGENVNKVTVWLR